MITINSDHGRIGELWWVNSDPRPIEKFLPLSIDILDTGMVLKYQLIRWGTCGIGRHVRIEMEFIDY